MNIPQAKNLIRFGIKHNFQYLLAGPPGIGKTEMCQQVAEELAINFMVLHPVVDEAIDYKGMPWIHKKNGKVKATFVPYDNLETLCTITEPTLVLIDDFGQAPEDVQKAFMQILGARQIAGKHISDNVTFVAATNRREDGAGVRGMLEPLKNRFDAIIEIEYDVDAHISWMLDNNMPLDLISFQRFEGYKFVEEYMPSRDIVNQPTPRSITKLGLQINNGLSKELLYEVSIGSVGKEYAIAYNAHREVWNKLPSPEEIMMSPDKAYMPTETEDGGLSALYAVSMMIATHASNINAVNVFHYINRMPKRFQVLTISDMTDINSEMTKTRPYVEWTIKNQSIFKGE